ncbi:MAG: glycosyltransferase, partial [Schleiferiaceae bacterium]|nr:glycosyltransferase [Schleiferiaceae bacterium]
MRIAVNTRLLIPQKLEGIGWFTREIFYRLVRTHPEVEWLFLFDRPVHPQLDLPEGLQVEVLPPPTRHPLLWYLWFEQRLPRFLARKKVDLLVSPDGFAPLKGSVPTLPVIHDLNFEHQPQNVPWLTGRYLRHFFPRIARQSRHLATVSEFSRQDLHQTYGVP